MIYLFISFTRVWCLTPKNTLYRPGSAWFGWQGFCVWWNRSLNLVHFITYFAVKQRNQNHLLTFESNDSIAVFTPLPDAEISGCSWPRPVWSNIRLRGILHPLTTQCLCLGVATHASHVFSLPNLLTLPVFSSVISYIFI